jgi:hypothetical protein
VSIKDDTSNLLFLTAQQVRLSPRNAYSKVFKGKRVALGTILPPILRS